MATCATTRPLSTRSLVGRGYWTHNTLSLAHASMLFYFRSQFGSEALKFKQCALELNLHHQEKAQTERLVCFACIAIDTPSCHARVSLCFFTTPAHICSFLLASPLVHSLYSSPASASPDCIAQVQRRSERQGKGRDRGRAHINCIAIDARAKRSARRKRCAERAGIVDSLNF